MSGGIGGGADEGFDLTSKGQIHGHDGTSQVAITVGTNGQFLKADSTQSSGLAWDTAGVSSESNTFTAVDSTWNPTSQTGNKLISLDASNFSGGAIKVNVDGSLYGNLTRTNLNAYVSPASSISLVSSSLGFNAVGTTYTAGNPASGVNSQIYNSGNKAFSYASKTVYEWNLSTPYNISSASLANSYTDSAINLGIRCFDMSSDGLFYVITTNNENWAMGYELSTAFDLSTVSYQTTIGLRPASNNHLDMAQLSDDGKALYCQMGHSWDRNCQYFILTNPYDFSSVASTATVGTSTTEVTNPSTVKVYNSGTKMILYDDSSMKFYRYSLSTPYDISSSSRSYDSVFYDFTSFTTSQQVSIKPDIVDGFSGTQHIGFGENYSGTAKTTIIDL